MAEKIIKFSVLVVFVFYFVICIQCQDSYMKCVFFVCVCWISNEICSLNIKKTLPRQWNKVKVSFFIFFLVFLQTRYTYILFHFIFKIWVVWSTLSISLWWLYGNEEKNRKWYIPLLIISNNNSNCITFEDYSPSYKSERLSFYYVWFQGFLEMQKIQ